MLSKFNKAGRGICCALSVVMLVNGIAGCSKFTKGESSSGLRGSESGSEDQDVQFELQEEGDPGFTGDSGSTIGLDGQPLYESDGQYDYELDPNTMERITGPLDPETHEPVDASSEGDIEGNAVPSSNPLADPEGFEAASEEVDENAPTDAKISGGSVGGGLEKATEYNKLPNTGIFMEDD